MRGLALACAVEVLARARDRSVYVMTAGLLVLVWLSVTLAANDYAARRDQYRRQLAELAREQVRPRGPLLGWAPEAVLRAVRPPAIGSLITRGADPALPAYVDFGPAGPVWAPMVAAHEGGPPQGTLLDLESIVRVLGGFLALLLGVDTIASARARGLLAAWEALDIPPWRTALGRVVGAWCIAGLATGLVMTTAAMAAAARLPGETGSIIGVVGRAGVPTLLYVMGFVTVGAACALWFRQMTTALIGALAFGVVSAMVWPQVVVLGAQLLAPAATRVDMEARRDRAFGQAVRAGENALGDEIVARAGGGTFAQTDGAIQMHRDALNTLWLTHATAARAEAEHEEAEWRRLVDRRAAIGTAGGLLSAGLPLFRALAALSGTGPEFASRWQDAVDAHQRALNHALFDDRPQVTARVPAQETRQLAPFVRRTGPRWSELPAWQEHPTPAAVQWRAATGPLLALLGHLGLAIAAVAIGSWRLRL